MLIINNFNICDGYYNNSPLIAAYWGSNLVWQKQLSNPYVRYLNGIAFKNIFDTLEYGAYSENIANICFYNASNEIANHFTKNIFFAYNEPINFRTTTRNIFIEDNKEPPSEIFLVGDCSYLLSKWQTQAYYFDIKNNKDKIPSLNFHYTENLAFFLGDPYYYNYKVYSRYSKNNTFYYYLFDEVPFSIDCGDNTLNLYRAYYNQNTIIKAKNLCGENTISLYGSYENCSNLVAFPQCKNNVIDMSRTYYNCSNLIGTPVCGDNVINMDCTYYNCSNITGQARISKKATMVSQTYAFSGVNEVARELNPLMTHYSWVYLGCHNIKNIYWDSKINYRNIGELDHYGFFNHYFSGVYADTGIEEAFFPFINNNSYYELESGYSMFQSCQNLHKINYSFDNNITKISGHVFINNSFSYCPNLKNIHFPNYATSVSFLSQNTGVTSINFDNLINTSSVTLDLSYSQNLIEVNSCNINYLRSYRTVYYYFENCSNLKIFNVSNLNLGDDTWAGGVKLNNCINLYSAKVDEFPHVNFYNCRNLKNIVLGKKIRELYHTFENCISLSSAILPEDFSNSNKTGHYPDGGLLFCMEAAFKNCTNLLSVNGGLQLFRSAADRKEIFCNCYNLVNVPTSFYNNAKYNFIMFQYDYNTNNYGIWNNTFANCYNLITAPFIPVRSYNGCYFYDTYWNCTNLRYLKVEGIDMNDYYNINKDMLQYNISLSRTFGYCRCLNKEGFGPLFNRILNNVSFLFETFIGCDNLYEAFEMPNVRLMEGAYSNCKNLITAYSGPNTIDLYSTYSDCPNLRGNLYLQNNNMNNISRCIYNRNNQNILNIYVNSNTKTNNTLYYNNLYEIWSNANYWNIWSNGLGYDDAKNNVYVYYLDKM